VFLELEMDRIINPDYTNLTASALRGLAYLMVWQKCIRDGMYNFHLDNGAFFQFCAESFDPFEARYSYYECPYSCISYRSYVREYLGLKPKVAGDLFMQEYSDYVLTCPQKESVTPIRYDYKPADYVEGRHPASHVHFGHLNDVRVATKRVLAPLSFFLLIIRQHYPDSWDTLLTHQKACYWCRNVRDNLESVGAEYCKPRDKLEMALD
jgi:hypothetical protein